MRMSVTMSKAHNAPKRTVSLLNMEGDGSVPRETGLLHAGSINMSSYLGSLIDHEICMGRDCIRRKFLGNTRHWKHKSPGSDGIHPRVLYELAGVFTAQLTTLFNTSLASEVSHMGNNSKVTNLLEALDIWTEALSHNLPVGVVFLDDAKAFDTATRAPPNPAVYTCIINNTLDWIRYFLTSRSQMVKVIVMMMIRCYGSEAHGPISGLKKRDFYTLYTGRIRFTMGDNSHSCRGFETPTLGNDLWPMGFDVDLALDGPGARKGPGGPLTSAGLGGGGLNSLQAGTNAGAGAYNDIHQLSNLSSIWQRFDDLQAGDICQMTDLTNSLAKGDSETAQSLLAKLAGQDLGPDLSSGADPSHKELESSLFDQAQGIPHGGAANGQGITLSHKSQLESAEIYGRMTCYGGKLILQLRHSNVNTNYTLNVSECWLCGEKVTAGSQLCTHKHSFNGVFQVNEEFIQLDIDHYIPEQTLDPQDGQEMTDSVLQHSDSSGMHHDLGSTRELELPENISGGDALVRLTLLVIYGW
ncbi:uncharacterized protein LOC134767487 [Penaeus indicus]|uniref:uncharacterized protein LOC134767487 n=1 Tax=Penaeus indicus TaxID=29960 RepID=UPI00300D56AA